MMSQKIFQIIRPVHVHLKMDKVDLKKKPLRKRKRKCIFFQSSHQVDMKNVVECPREFLAYFNALETRGGQHIEFFETMNSADGHLFILAGKKLISFGILQEFLSEKPTDHRTPQSM